MTVISGNSFQFNVSRTTSQHSFNLQTTQQAMQTMMLNLQHCAPQLANEVSNLLAMQGHGMPAGAFDQAQNPFAAMSAMDPRAAMRGGGQPLAHDNYWSPQEVMQGLQQMYGAQAPSLDARANDTMNRSQGALMAAMAGGDLELMVGILGANNPHSRGLAKRIQGLARELTRTPPDFGRISQLAQKADWGMLNHATVGDKAGRNVLKQMFQQQYGISRPGSQPYFGGGAFGNQVEGITGTHPVPEPTGSGAGPRALSVAQSQVGVREATGNNDGLPAQRYSNGRREPWCANFVAWTFRQSGNPLPGNQRRLASVQHMEDSMKKNNKWFPRGGGTPQPGDVIFFGNRGASDRGPGRHVGIVEKVENGKVYTVEGNSSNSVRRRSYDLNNARITGYGRN